MDQQNETAAEAVENAVVESANAAVETATEMMQAPAKAVRAARKPRARKASTRAKAAAARAEAPVSKTARKARKSAVRNTRRVAAAVAAAAPATTKETAVNFDSVNWMNNFANVPGAENVQNLFAGASERGQEIAERSQRAAGDMVELTRANVEALIESGRIAAAGAQTLGQDAVARSREGFEQAAAQVKSLAQVQSPTEFFQLQGEIARNQFDRMVAEGSRFTESLVKLAGEAIQPLSNRAALNAEKVNEYAA